MGERQKKVISICVWSAVIFFVIRCALSWESIVSSLSVYDLFGYAGEAISIAVIFAGLYEKFFGDLIRSRKHLSWRSAM